MFPTRAIKNVNVTPIVFLPPYPANDFSPIALFKTVFPFGTAQETPLIEYSRPVLAKKSIAISYPVMYSKGLTCYQVEQYHIGGWGRPCSISQRILAPYWFLQPRDNS